MTRERVKELLKKRMREEGNSDVEEKIKAAMDHQDAEIGGSASEIQKEKIEREIWEPSRVSGRFEGKPTSEVLKAIQQQTNNTIVTGGENGQFHEAPLFVTWDNVPFWKALDELCQRSGNQVHQHFDMRSPSLLVAAGEYPKCPVAYEGPVRSRVTSIRRVFIEEFDQETGKSDVTHTYQMTVQVMWEQGFKLVAYKSQPDLLHIKTDQGVILNGGPASGASWNIATKGSRQVAMTLRMDPPSVQSETLDELTYGWGVIAVGGMKTMEITDLESTEPHCQDDFELSIESIEERTPSRFEVILVINRDLVIPQPQEIVFQENDFEFTDAEGNPFRIHGQTNNLSDEGAKIKFTIASDIPGAVPSKLIATHPTVRSEMRLEIKHKNVPLASTPIE